MPGRSPRRGSTACRWARSRSTRALLRRLGRRHGPADVASAVAAAREAGIASISLDLLYDVPGQSERVLGRLARRGSGARARPRLRLCPHARRSGRRGTDGTDGRPPADDDGRATLADGGDPRSRTTIGRPRSTGWPWTALARPGSAATRSPTGRDPATRAGTTSPTGRAGRTRRWVPARTRSTAPSAAGTPRGSTGTCGALAPADGREPSLPPGGQETIEASSARVEATILGLRLDTGLALADAEGGPLAPHLDVGAGRRVARAVGRRWIARPPDHPRPAPLERAVLTPRLGRGPAVSR